MSYSKLTLSSFKKSLKEGKYTAAAGARRAVGKSSELTEDEKDKARRAIDAHFGEASSAPTKTKATVGRKPAKTKAEVVAKKEGKVKKTKAKAAPKAEPVAAPKVKRTPRRTNAAAASTGVTPDVTQHLPNIPQELATNLYIGEKAVDSFSGALKSLAAVRQQYPSVDLSEHVREAGEGIMISMRKFRQVINQITGDEPNTSEETIQATTTEPALISPPVSNGLDPDVSGQQAFEQSLPDDSFAVQGN